MTATRIDLLADIGEVLVSEEQIAAKVLERPGKSLLSKPRHRLVQEVDVLVGGGSEQDTRRAGGDRFPDRLDRTQAATDLDRDWHLCRDTPDVLEIDRRAVARAVEVHHMQLAGALVHPRARRLEGVVDVDGLLLEVPLPEAHRLAAANVDRRQEDHAARRSAEAAILVKLASRRSPFSLDFSGWNCVP